MKKFIPTVLFFCSLSSFADCTLDVEGHSFPSRHLKILSKKYELINGPSRFKLEAGGQCLGDGCSIRVVVTDRDGSEYSATGGDAVLRVFDLNGTFAQSKATKIAFNNLRSCL